MVVHNPNNWHWVDKNCLPWAKSYFQEVLPNTTQKNDAYEIVVTSVDLVDGDCDVTQRKGVTKCIFDLKIQVSATAKVNTNSEVEEISYTVTLPELVHDQDEDEYEYVIEGNLDHKSQIRKLLTPLLTEKLSKFQQALIDAHTQDVQHST
ncbi:hypothetical protein LJB42_004851 [Komagataella kurtzmanii]|nr:hypothetical protein LJB42_004851 [Komagataella kurtzmanii]